MLTGKVASIKLGKALLLKFKGGTGLGTAGVLDAARELVGAHLTAIRAWPAVKTGGLFPKPEHRAFVGVANPAHIEAEDVYVSTCVYIYT